MAFNKWRDRAVEAVGDGAEELGFARLDFRVERDRLGAGGEDVFLNLGNGLGEPVESGIEVDEIAFARREPRNLGASNPA